MSTYFANVGKQFAHKIPNGKHDIKHYLQKIPSNDYSIFLTPTSKTEITKLISSLKNKNSNGRDGISNKILKGITESIVEPLNIIFNKSMEEGVFPTEMKKADTVPLYKSKDKDDKNNYRPISLLLTVSKLLEKIMYSRTYNFLTKYNQIYSSQYGFKTGHSCQDAIAELIGEIARNLDEGLYTIGVFLDLSKVFDTLEHEVLFDKLAIYGIRGVALEWYKSYLRNRQLRVKCMVASSSKQENSHYEQVTYGTPQGSCLGPLLFLIFSNDLFRNLDYCNNLQFADDTTIYKGHRNLRYLIWCIENDLSNLDDWFRANKLTLNVGKSVHMVFSKKKNVDTCIKLGDTELPKVEIIKFLGMWLDQNLTWDEHLSKLKSRIRRNMSMLQVGVNLLDIHSKKILMKNRYRKHIKNIKILRMKDALTLENCKMVYRLQHKLLPKKLVQLYYTNQQGKSLIKTHGYNTRNKMIPNLAKTHCKEYNTSYLCSSLKDYQNIKVEIRQAKSLKTFNVLLKETLLTW